MFSVFNVLPSFLCSLPVPFLVAAGDDWLRHGGGGVKLAPDPPPVRDWQRPEATVLDDGDVVVCVVEAAAVHLFLGLKN